MGHTFWGGAPAMLERPGERAGMGRSRGAGVTVRMGWEGERWDHWRPSQAARPSRLAARNTHSLRA